MKTVWNRLKHLIGGPQAQAEALSLTDPDTISGFKELATALRTSQPVCPVSGGGVLLLDPEDVKQAFSNATLSNQPSRFSALAARNKDKYVAASVASHILPFLDGPDHIARRQWASKAFFQHLKGFEGRIAEISARHCQAVPPRKTAVLVEDVARGYVVDVIGQFVGLDLTPAEMKQYTSSLFRLFAPAYDAETFAKTNEGLTQARACLMQALTARRMDQSPCLLNALDGTFPDAFAPEDRDLLIVDNTLLFLADGVENVEAAVGVVMARHAEAPQPITPVFVRDAIMDDTPGQTIARIALDDMALGGTRISAGTPVFLSLASANDGAAKGEEFTFGRGRHKCLGENFAISMVTEMCRDLVDRDPIIDTSALTYKAMFGHKWPRGITVTLGR